MSIKEELNQNLTKLSQLQITYIQMFFQIGKSLQQHGLFEEHDEIFKEQLNIASLGTDITLDMENLIKKLDDQQMNDSTRTMN